MPVVEQIIKPCEAADKEVFRKYFATLEHASEFTLTPHIIKRGWGNGLWPPSPRRIMALWSPEWTKFTPSQQDYVMCCVRLIARQIIGLNKNNEPENPSPFVIG